MIAKGIASILRSLVGDYIEGIEDEHLKVGKMLRKGEIVLRDLKIKSTALEALQLPLRVKSGTVATLQAKVPWAHLSSKPVVLSLEGVKLVVETESHDKSSISRLHAARQRTIRVIDHFNRERETSAEGTDSSIFGDNHDEDDSDVAGDSNEQEGREGKVTAGSRRMVEDNTTKTANNNHSGATVGLDESEFIDGGSASMLETKSKGSTGKSKKAKFKEKLGKRIVDNLVLDIRNLEVCLEEEGFTCGLNVEHITLHTTDGSWTRQQFVDRSRKGASSKIRRKMGDYANIFRIAQVRSCHVYWEDSIGPRKKPQYHEEASSSSLACVPEHSSRARNRIPLVHPFTTTAKIVLLPQSNSAIPDRVKCNVELDAIKIDWHARQYREMISLFDRLSTHEMHIIQAAIQTKYRPHTSIRPTDDPRSWWRYAYKGVMAARNPVLIGFPRSFGPTHLNLFAVCTLVRQRNRYVSLHKRYLSSGGSSGVKVVNTKKKEASESSIASALDERAQTLDSVDGMRQSVVEAYGDGSKWLAPFDMEKNGNDFREMQSLEQCFTVKQVILFRRFARAEIRAEGQRYRNRKRTGIGIGKMLRSKRSTDKTSVMLSPQEKDDLYRKIVGRHARVKYSNEKDSSLYPQNLDMLRVKTDEGLALDLSIDINLKEFSLHLLRQKAEVRVNDSVEASCITRMGMARPIARISCDCVMLAIHTGELGDSARFSAGLRVSEFRVIDMYTPNTKFGAVVRRCKLRTREGRGLSSNDDVLIASIVRNSKYNSGNKERKADYEVELTTGALRMNLVLPLVEQILLFAAWGSHHSEIQLGVSNFTMSQRLASLREGTSQQIREALETHKTVNLKVDIVAPTVLIPLNPSVANGRSLLLNLGRVKAHTVAFGVNSGVNHTDHTTSKEPVEHGLLKLPAFDKYLVTLSGLCLDAYNKDQATLDGNQNILAPIDIYCHVCTSVMPTNPSVPLLQLSTSMPPVKFVLALDNFQTVVAVASLWAKRIEGVLSFINSPSFTSPDEEINQGHLLSSQFSASRLQHTNRNASSGSLVSDERVERRKFDAEIDVPSILIEVHTNEMSMKGAKVESVTSCGCVSLEVSKLRSSFTGTNFGTSSTFEIHDVLIRESDGNQSCNGEESSDRIKVVDLLRCPKKDGESEPVVVLNHKYVTLLSPQYNGIDSLLDVNLGEIHVTWDNQGITEFIDLSLNAIDLSLDMKSTAQQLEYFRKPSPATTRTRSRSSSFNQQVTASSKRRTRRPNKDEMILRVHASLKNTIFDIFDRGKHLLLIRTMIFGINSSVTAWRMSRRVQTKSSCHNIIVQDMSTWVQPFKDMEGLVGIPPPVGTKSSATGRASLNRYEQRLRLASNHDYSKATIATYDPPEVIGSMDPSKDLLQFEIDSKYNEKTQASCMTVSAHVEQIRFVFLNPLFKLLNRYFDSGVSREVTDIASKRAMQAVEHMQEQDLIYLDVHIEEPLLVLPSTRHTFFEEECGYFECNLGHITISKIEDISSFQSLTNGTRRYERDSMAFRFNATDAKITAVERGHGLQWNRRALVLERRELTLNMLVEPTFYDDNEWGGIELPHLQTFWRESGLEFKPPPKNITLGICMKDDLIVNLTHSQFSLFENLLKYNFADFRKTPSRHAAPALPLFASSRGDSFEATMKNRPLEFHLFLQVAEVSVNLIHGWGAHSNKIPIVPLYILRAENLTLDLREYVARLVHFDLCASSGSLVDVRERLHGVSTGKTRVLNSNSNIVAEFGPKTGCGDVDNDKSPLSLQLIKYPAEDQAIALNLLKPCIWMHADNLTKFIEFFVNCHDFDEGGLDVGAIVRYRLPGESSSAPERRGVIMRILPDYRFDILLDPRDHIPVLMSHIGEPQYHMRTQIILDYTFLRSEERVQRFWNPRISTSLKLNAVGIVIHLTDSEHRVALKLAGDVDLVFARNRDGVKKLEVKSDGENPGQGELELSLVFPTSDRVEHTLAQRLPLAIDFKETVLEGGTHSHSSDRYQSRDTCGPYLHRQGALLIGDLHMTCGLDHIEAISAIIDDNIESLSNIESISHMTADFDGSSKGSEVMNNLIGRVPEYLTLDLGTEILAREMGGLDVIIDTVFMVLTERVRFIVVSERYNHGTDTILFQPMIRLRLAHPVLKLTMQHNSRSIHVGLNFADDDHSRSKPAHLRKGISIYFYNLHVLCWEPVLEPWRFSANIRLRSNFNGGDGEATFHGSSEEKLKWGTDVHVHSSFDLNFNASYPFFEMIDNWWSSKLGVFVKRIASDERYENLRAKRSHSFQTAKTNLDAQSPSTQTEINQVQSENTMEASKKSALELATVHNSCVPGPADIGSAKSTHATTLVYQHVVYNDTGLPFTFTVRGGGLSGFESSNSTSIAPGDSAVFEVSEMKVEERWYENPWIGRDVPSLCVRFDCGAWLPVENIPVEKGTKVLSLQKANGRMNKTDSYDSNVQASSGFQYESTHLLCDTMLENGRLICRFASLINICNQCDVPIELLLCGGSIPSVEMLPLLPKASVSLPIHMTYKRLCVRPLVSDIDSRSSERTHNGSSRVNGPKDSANDEYQWWAGFDIQKYVSLGLSAPAITTMRLPRLNVASVGIQNDSSQSNRLDASASTFGSKAKARQMPDIWCMRMLWRQKTYREGKAGRGVVQKSRVTQPSFSVTFLPYAIVTNLLPAPLYLKLAGCAGRPAGNSSTTEPEVLNGNSGKTSAVLVVHPTKSLFLYSKPKSESLGLTVSLSLDLQRWSQFVRLQESASSLKRKRLKREKSRNNHRAGNSFDFKAVEDRQINLYRPHTSHVIPLRVSLANSENYYFANSLRHLAAENDFSTYTRHLEIFCRYWLVNQTQMVLKLRGKTLNDRKDTDVTFRFDPHDRKAISTGADATQPTYDQYFENDVLDKDSVVTPVMYSGSDIVYLSVGVPSKLLGPENRDAFSEWSTQEFDMSLLGSVQGVVHCRESKSASMSRTLNINNYLQMHNIAQEQFQAEQKSKMAVKKNTWFSSSKIKRTGRADLFSSSSASKPSSSKSSSLSEGISQGEYSIGVQMSSAPAPFHKTRLIVFTPHIVIVNKCSTSPIQIMQTPEYGSPRGPLKSPCSNDSRLSNAILSRIDDNDATMRWGVSIPPQLSLLPNVGQPFHWLDASVPVNSRMIAIRPYEEDPGGDITCDHFESPLLKSGWHWSGAIKVNQVGDIAVSVRSYSSGERRHFRVTNVNEGATLFIVITDESVEFPLYRLVNDSQEILHYRQCLQSFSSTSTAAMTKAEKSKKAFLSPKPNKHSMGSSPSILRQRSVSKVGRLLPGEATVFGWDEPHVSSSSKDITQRRAITVFTPSAPQGSLVYIDEVGSETKLILPPSRLEGKNSHRMLFACTRVQGPTKTVIFSEVPPDRNPKTTRSSADYKGSQAHNLDQQNAVAKVRSQATAMVRTQTQAALQTSAKMSKGRTFRSMTHKNLANMSGKQLDADISLSSITLALNCVNVSFISHNAEELLLASVSRIVFVHNTWAAASSRAHFPSPQGSDQTIELSIDDFQLDNMVDGAINEVLLASTGNLKNKPDLEGIENVQDMGKKKASHPFIQVSIIKPHVSPDIDFFSYISILVQEFEITTDRTILDKHALVALHIAELFQSREEMRQRLATDLDKKNSKYSRSIFSKKLTRDTSQDLNTRAERALTSSANQARAAIKESMIKHQNLEIDETLRMSGTATESFISNDYGSRSGMSVVGISAASSTVTIVFNSETCKAEILNTRSSVHQTSVGILPSGSLQKALKVATHVQHNSQSTSHSLLSGSTSRRVYVQLLHLHPLKFRLSYHHSTVKKNIFTRAPNIYRSETNTEISSDYTSQVERHKDIASMSDSRENLSMFLNSNFASTAGVFLIDIDTDLHLKGLVHQDVFTDWIMLSSILKKHYLREVQKQVLSMTGAANSLLGDPVRLITGLGGGARDFFYLPASGLIKSPKEFGRGVARGSYSLIFKGVLGGTTNTLAKVTAGMSRGVATLSLDSEYLAERAIARRTERVSNIGNGIYFGAKRLGIGIAQGVTGIVSQPVKGAMREGVKGFIKGAARGVVGAIVKPTVGVTDFLSSATAGTTAGIDGAFRPSMRKAKRVRLPRLMYGDVRILKVYNEEEAYVKALMLSIYMNNYTGKPLRSMASPSLARMDASTFKVSDYVTHLYFSESHVLIITKIWLTIFSNVEAPSQSKSKVGTRTKNARKKSISLRLPNLLLALPLNSIVTVDTSDDGRSVLFGQGHSAAATKYNISVGSPDKAALIVQRVNHIVSEFRRLALGDI